MGPRAATLRWHLCKLGASVPVGGAEPVRIDTMFRALPWRATAPLFRTSVLAALVAAVTTTAGCSGDGKGKGGGTGPGTATTTPIDAAVATPIDAGPRIEPVVVKPKIDHPPELELPAWQAVGVGQTISFSTAVIDQDLDETASRVTAMPASARFDALTQTVTWTPISRAYCAAWCFHLG